jgi:hypothetical protein
VKSLPRIGPSESGAMRSAKNLRGSKTGSGSDGAHLLVAGVGLEGFGWREATTSWAPMDSNKERGVGARCGAFLL